MIRFPASSSLAEDLAECLFLPGRQQERLAVPFVGGMLQEFFKEIASKIGMLLRKGHIDSGFCAGPQN